MEKFAKVFESHGRQFLVKKSATDDSRDKLSIITQIDGVEIDIGLVFDVDDDGEALDAAFEAYAQEDADLIGEKLKGVDSPFAAFKALTK